MKNFSFDGRLGKDAEVLSTKGGKPYVRFSVANNSFSGGVEKTEWIDVTSYDQYVVENRAKYLTKGTYVIVNGDVRFDVSIKEGKVWKNVYVTAYSIDTPNFGKRDDEAENGAEAVNENAASATQQPAAEPTTYKVKQEKVVEEPALTTGMPMSEPVEAASAVGGDDANDLPF